jgi:predicted AAA+ superfamily ATPase
MTEDATALLARIAAALDRLAGPPAADADATARSHYHWDGARLAAVEAAPALPAERFVGVDAQIAALRRTFGALRRGAPAHDVLLWGARGTGKSALVRSLGAEAGLAMVEAAGDRLDTLPALFDRLRPAARPFLVFIDDVAFAAADAGVRLLRSLLDGGIVARPANVRLVVTSNHRHLLERGPAPAEAGPTARHARDVADDQLALVDRFGLVLGFHVPDQDAYLEMVRRHLAAEGLDMDETEALAFALARGGRSGRTAWHYRTECLARRASAQD